MSKTPKTRKVSRKIQSDKRHPPRKTAKKARRGATHADAKTPARRSGTKQAILIELLKRPKGATIGQMAAKTGWQAHSVRGAISGALKKKLGLVVTSELTEGRGRVYRIAGAR